MSDYWVVYAFTPNKSSASKMLSPLKKKFESAKIEIDKDGQFVVTLGHTETLREANELIHEAVAQGFWGGIYKK